MLNIRTACDELGPEGVQVIAAYILGVSHFLSEDVEALQQSIPITDFEAMGLRGALDFSFDERKADFGEVRKLSFFNEIDVHESEIMLEISRRILQSDASQGEEFWETAQSVVALGLRSEIPLIRICAINASLILFSEMKRTVELRLKWFRSRPERLNDPLVESVFEATRELSRKSSPTNLVSRSKQKLKNHRKRSPGLVLIHGTHFSFNVDPTWYVPNLGDTHEYVRRKRNDTYSKPDFFEWEGAHNDRGRSIAAKNLVEWSNRRGLLGADFMCHSHGGNVALEATRYGLETDRLVFLSCPFWWEKYSPKPSSVGEMISVRVRWDYVILAGGVKFGFKQVPPPTVGVREVVLETKWFDHSATTDHTILEREQVLEKIGIA